MLPFAPERLSMMTTCFHVSVIFWPISRARKSDVPPGGYGMIQRIGFTGYSCAGAVSGAAAPARASRSRHRRWRFNWPNMGAPSFADARVCRTAIVVQWHGLGNPGEKSRVGSLEEVVHQEAHRDEEDDEVGHGQLPEAGRDAALAHVHDEKRSPIFRTDHRV